MRPSFGPPLPRLEQRDALRRAAACERPHAAQRKNVGPTALALPRVVIGKELLSRCGCTFAFGRLLALARPNFGLRELYV